MLAAPARAHLEKQCSHVGRFRAQPRGLLGHRLAPHRPLAVGLLRAPGLRLPRVERLGGGGGPCLPPATAAAYDVDMDEAALPLVAGAFASFGGGGGAYVASLVAVNIAGCERHVAAIDEDSASL